VITPRLAWRLLQIDLVLARHGLDEIIYKAHLLRPFRFLLWLLPWYWFPRARGRPRGERIRLALEELGPIFVKFGQALSTRRDLLPVDVADELAKLQDQVPPFPGAEARAAIEAALGQPLEACFAAFETECFASASIAQVHAATLPDGREVVVKVLRPGVERQVRRDLEVLRLIARLAERYWDDGRRLRPLEVLDEIEKNLIDELDLMREAGNAAQLKRNFTGSALLYVPEVHWDLCRESVLVTERIRGIPVSRLDALTAAGTDMRVLAHRGVEIFFTQVFKHNFFHADMHPGNIFVDVADPQQPRYMAVDFGIVGTLAPRDQQYIAETFLAFFQRDYRRIAEVHIESGWVPEGTRVDEFETAVRTVAEPIFNKPLAEISFGHLLLRLFQVARRFDMQVQPQLVLLQKTLLNIEGLGRQLYPELDLWETGKPFMEEWAADQLSGRATFERLRRDLPSLRDDLTEVAQLVKQVLRQAADGKLVVEYQSGELSELRRTLRRNRRHTYLATAGGTLVVAGALWVALEAGPPLAGLVLLGTGLGALIVGALRA
jgi:ubiquinone biosynthesis protein